MSDLKSLDSEISRLQAEAAAVERAGPTFDERWPEIENELVQAENLFRQVGPQLGGFVSQLPEHVDERRRAMVGAVMVANRKAVIDSERARVKAATQGGVSTADKARRLSELRGAILKAAARRELKLREVEVEGEFKPRPPLHGELSVFRRAALEELAR